MVSGIGRSRYFGGLLGAFLLIKPILQPSVFNTINLAPVLHHGAWGARCAAPYLGTHTHKILSLPSLVLLQEQLSFKSQSHCMALYEVREVATPTCKLGELAKVPWKYFDRCYCFGYMQPKIEWIDMTAYRAKNNKEEAHLRKGRKHTRVHRCIPQPSMMVKEIANKTTICTRARARCLDETETGHLSLSMPG